jgi:hypothetical protein
LGDQFLLSLGVLQGHGDEVLVPEVIIEGLDLPACIFLRSLLLAEESHLVGLDISVWIFILNDLYIPLI